MAKVSCPDCKQEMTIDPDTRSGDLIPCPNCAGILLRVSERNEQWTAAIVKQASCAVGDEMLILPDEVKPGDIIECHGVKQRVTLEFGAYALEKV